MKNIAIIPARSGSKGLRDKNIKELNGKPLLWYSIQAAINSGCFDEVMVSTDSEKYAEIAKECGAKVPFLRSKLQSSDTASSWDVVEEVVDKYHSIGINFDTVCLLQPTSPLREAADIIGAYNTYTSKNADSITSVCEVEHSPMWCMVLPEDNSLITFRKKQKSVPRQQLSKFHRLNGSIYIRKIEYVGDDIVIKNSREFAFIMDRKKSIDIDTIEDFEMAKYLINVCEGGGKHRFDVIVLLDISFVEGWCAA